MLLLLAVHVGAAITRQLHCHVKSALESFRASQFCFLGIARNSSPSNKPSHMPVFVRIREVIWLRPNVFADKWTAIQLPQQSAFAGVWRLRFARHNLESDGFEEANVLPSYQGAFKDLLYCITCFCHIPSVLYNLLLPYTFLASFPAYTWFGIFSCSKICMLRSKVSGVMQVAANGKASHVPDTLAVAWNHKADHILASWSGGMLTVHDLKQQKPRCSLRDDNR